MLNYKVSGEREAEAILKGKVRQAIYACDETTKKIECGYFSGKKRTHKLVKEFFCDQINSYGEFLVTNIRFKPYGVGSTKHWKNEYTAIEPEFVDTLGVGELCRFVVNYFDSKRFAKSDINANLTLSSQFYFHKHFLIRSIQRLNQKDVGEIGAFVYPIIEWLVTEQVPLSRIDNNNYFVYRDYTIVADRLPKSKGMVFTTLLETEFYDDEQRRKFADAHKELDGSNPEEVLIVMTNPNGQVVRKIPSAQGKSLVNSINENTYWIKNVFFAPDARGDQLSLIDKLKSL